MVDVIYIACLTSCEPLYKGVHSSSMLVTHGRWDSTHSREEKFPNNSNYTWDSDFAVIQLFQFFFRRTLRRNLKWSSLKRRKWKIMKTTRSIEDGEVERPICKFNDASIRISFTRKVRISVSHYRLHQRRLSAVISHHSNCGFKWV